MDDLKRAQAKLAGLCAMCLKSDNLYYEIGKDDTSRLIIKNNICYECADIWSETIRFVDDDSTELYIGTILLAEQIENHNG